MWRTFECSKRAIKNSSRFAHLLTRISCSTSALFRVKQRSIAVLLSLFYVYLTPFGPTHSGSFFRSLGIRFSVDFCDMHGGAHFHIYRHREAEKPSGTKPARLDLFALSGSAVCYCWVALRGVPLYLRLHRNLLALSIFGLGLLDECFTFWSVSSLLQTECPQQSFFVCQGSEQGKIAVQVVFLLRLGGSGSHRLWRPFVRIFWATTRLQSRLCGSHILLDQQSNG